MTNAMKRTQAILETSVRLGDKATKNDYDEAIFKVLGPTWFFEDMLVEEHWKQVLQTPPGS